MLKSMFKDNKEELGRLIFANFRKTKLDELTVQEASFIIDLKKGENNNE